MIIIHVTKGPQRLKLIIKDGMANAIGRANRLRKKGYIIGVIQVLNAQGQ